MSAAPDQDAYVEDIFDAAPSIPCDAEELRRRARTFLSAVAPTLDSIESELDSWERFRKVSAATKGVPAKSTFRQVRIDSFTVRQPPPTVSELEITAYIKKLSTKDLKTLYDEYELTYVDGFDYVNADEGNAGAAALTSTHIVHIVDALEEEGHENRPNGKDDEEAHRSTEPPTPVTTTHPTAAAHSAAETTPVESPTDTEDVPLPETDVAEPTPPAFSLEQMSPSSIAAHERRAHASFDASDPNFRFSAPTHSSGFGGNDGCTVEIEYTADHFLPGVSHRALRDNAGTGITVTAAPAMHTASVPAGNYGVCGELPPESDNDGGEDEIRSFSSFSRMVLADAGRRQAFRRTALEATGRLVPLPLPSAEAVRHADTQPSEVQATVMAVPLPSTAKAESSGTGTPSAPRTPAAEATPAPSSPKEHRAAGRDAFVRQRVRDILLANRVRAIDAATLGAAFFAKMDTGLNAAADRTTPLLHRLDHLLCESTALLHTLEVLDHQAYKEHVTDPTQYLCVPRYSVACAAPDCENGFSTINTRVMCGRCGQFFCPKCCSERGLGPDVKCGDKRYSLGWEPLCRICYDMCRESQQKLVEERNQYRRIADASFHSDTIGHRDGSSAEDGGHDPAVAQEAMEALTLKQAVIFGTYCDEQRCLGDGLPPFYVIHRDANEAVAFWDLMSYRFAKTQGSLRRGWQNAGSLAAHMVQSAAQMMSKRRGTLR